MARKNAAYHDGEFAGKSAMVTEVTEKRIEYREIYRWDYGVPALGDRHSASPASFRQQYPHEVDWSLF